MNKLDMESKNIVNDNITKIEELFPNVVSEGKIDFEMLKQELSDEIIDEKKEKYQLTWPGKKNAILNANSKINKTLRPECNKSQNFDDTKNIYIEGDNLEVLKLLQESYLNKIDCIYIDPPYNTGNDFIYPDNYDKTAEDELTESGQVDENGYKLVSNMTSNGRFHSDWLSMMYPRLKLARNLLSPKGAIYISIDENEIKNLKCICDEIFGEKNFVNCVAVKMSVAAGLKMSNKNKKMIKIKEYLLIYSKSEQFEFANIDALYIDKDTYEVERSDKYIENIDDEPYNWYFCSLHEAYNKYKEGNETKLDFVNRNSYRVFNHVVNASTKKNWEKLSSSDKEKYTNKVRPYNVEGSDYQYAYNDHVLIPYNPKILEGDMWCGNYAIGGTKSPEGGVVFNNGKKPLKLLDRILKIATTKDSIVLDFFSGSASTAHAVMQLNAEDNGNRKFILVQIPENCENDAEAKKEGFKTICDLGEERIRRSSKKIKDETKANIDYGFRVYKVDSSNMKDVYYKPSDVKQLNLLDYISNIKEDRTSEDLLTQVILDLGLTLDLKIEEKSILSNKVFYVEDNSLVACFDEQVDINIIDEICKCNPMKVVFKDISFKTDKDKINLEERIKKLSPETEINIL